MSYLSRQKVLESSKCYSNYSCKTREDSGVFCSYCKSSKEDLHAQITQLKDKAHQSFMQVLQIQQLHDEQITLLREQFNQKESQVRQEMEKLKQQNELLKKELTSLQKNTKKHTWDFGTNQFVIENIDAILCKEEEISYLDESELIQFQDLLKIQRKGDCLSNLRNQIYKDMKFVNNNKTQIQKLFLIIKEYKDQNITLIQKNQEISRKLSLSQNQLKAAKQASESLNYEIKFMSEQVKRLGNDKLKLQKKVNQFQRSQSRIDDNPATPKVLKLKIQTHFKRSTRDSIKSLSPNFRMEIFDQENQPYLNGSRQLESKLQVNQQGYARFMGSDSMDIDQNSSKRNTEIKRKTRNM